MVQVFEGGERRGREQLQDFQDGVDDIVLSIALWGGVAPDVTGLLAAATVTETGISLDLGGGATLDIAGVFDASLLADDILFL